MTPLDHAVDDITRALESLRITYAIIGGIATPSGVRPGAIACEAGILGAPWVTLPEQLLTARYGN